MLECRHTVIFAGLLYRMEKHIGTLDWNDTFLSEEHLKHSFPDHDVVMEKSEEGVENLPPFT